MLVELRLHEIPTGAVTTSVIVPMKPFCGETVIVAVPEAPLLKLRDEPFAVAMIS